MPREINSAHAATIVLRDSALALAQGCAQSAKRCGELLDQAAEHVGQDALNDWITEHCPDIHVEQARRYRLVARRLNSMTELTNSGVRQLYMDLGLMPETDYTPPEDGKPARVTDWLKWTTRIDGVISNLTRPQKEQLRTWCQSMLRRLA